MHLQNWEMSIHAAQANIGFRVPVPIIHYITLYYTTLHYIIYRHEFFIDTTHLAVP